VAASNPAPRPAGSDRVPVALTKYVDDWRDEPVRTLPAENHAWTLGRAEGKVRIVMWGDYEEPGTREADAYLRQYVKGAKSASYTFRHYPFDTECAPKVPDKRHPNACRSARAAEAAAILGGNEAFWKMHEWLMAHGERYTDAELSAAASAAGLDGAAVVAGVGNEEPKARVTEDVRAADALPTLRIGVGPGLYAIPTIFINGRYVPRWQIDNRNILGEILKAASADS